MVDEPDQGIQYAYRNVTTNLPGTTIILIRTLKKYLICRYSYF
jgi:hypothetical protein